MAAWFESVRGGNEVMTGDKWGLTSQREGLCLYIAALGAAIVATFCRKVNQTRIVSIVS